MLFLFPPIFFIHEQRINITIQAQSIMTAYGFSTYFTAPFVTFLLYEFFHAKFLDVVEVFYHAHMVFCTVALIQCLQSFTREAFAFITKPDATFCQQFARISHMRAVFSPRNASRAIFFIKSTLVKILFSELKRDT